MSIKEYNTKPRYGMIHASRHVITGMGPCAEIFFKYGWYHKDHPPVPGEGMEKGKKLFDDDDCTRFLLNIRPNYFLAISSRSIASFIPDRTDRPEEGQATVVLSIDDDVVGHGKIEELRHTRTKVDDYHYRDNMDFQLLLAFASGKVRQVRVSIDYVYERAKSFAMQVTTLKEEQMGARLLAAPIVDKRSLALIYEDTIVRPDKTVGRGTAAEGRQVVAAGATPWKSKILLATDNGQVHIVKMTETAGDGDLPLLDAGKCALSSTSLDIREPTCFACWRDEIVVGNENGDMYRLERKTFRQIDEYEMEYGPLCFLYTRGTELWIGSKDGILQNYDDIC